MEPCTRLLGGRRQQPSTIFIILSIYQQKYMKMTNNSCVPVIVVCVVCMSEYTCRVRVWTEQMAQSTLYRGCKQSLYEIWTGFHLGIWSRGSSANSWYLPVDKHPMSWLRAKLHAKLHFSCSLHQGLFSEPTA